VQQGSIEPSTSSTRAAACAHWDGRQVAAEDDAHRWLLLDGLVRDSLPTLDAPPIGHDRHANSTTDHASGEDLLGLWSQYARPDEVAELCRVHVVASLAPEFFANLVHDAVAGDDSTEGLGRTNWPNGWLPRTA